MIAGFESPDEGKDLPGDEQIDELTQTRRSQVGIQSYALLLTTTPLTMLQYGPKPGQWTRQ